MTAELDVELHGGPVDGTIGQVMQGDDGLPLERITVLECVSSEYAAPITAGQHVYQRGHINEDTHRWRYNHVA